jgi:hypothetical protein
MLIKIACATAICICSWLLGNGYKNSLSEKIKIIEEYISFSIGLKSAVSFSGKNLYEYIKNSKFKHLKAFGDYLCENKDIGIEKNIKSYISLSLIEKECIEKMEPSLLLLESSSDVYGIAEQLDESIRMLELYKNEIREAYCGKIKTAPSLALITGLFVAVLLI